MGPDKYQQAWHAHSSQTRVTIDTDLLLREVQRNQQDFRTMILLRDSSEIAFSLLLLALWIGLGITMGSPWTWYLMVPVLLWTIGFILVVRARHKRIPPAVGEPLLRCVKESLADVEHQIWLRRNAFWWFVLPTAFPLLAFIIHASWLKARDLLDALVDVNALIVVFLVALFYFLYRMNRRMAGLEYEPRRQELRALLASLEGESTGEHGGDSGTAAE